MKKLAVLLALFALGAFALVACGGDDDEVDPGAATEPAPGNPLRSQGVATGFESGLAGWEPHGAAIIEQTTDRGRSGEGSLEVATLGSSRSEGATTITMPANAETTYRAAAWVRGPRGARLRLTLMERMGDGAHGTTDEMFVATGDWERVTLERAFGENAEEAQLYIRTADTLEITFYVDDVELRAD